MNKGERETSTTGELNLGDTAQEQSRDPVLLASHHDLRRHAFLGSVSHLYKRGYLAAVQGFAEQLQ